MIRNLKKVFILFSILVLGFFVAGCNNEEEVVEQGNYPITITDSMGEEVTIESEPETVVSLSPVITEIVAAVGSEDKLVGRTTYCDYPESVSSVDTIGDLMTVNVEKIVELNPDIVIGSAFIDENVKETIEGAGIQVVTVYSEESINGTYSDIETIGEILNESEEASNIVDGMKDKIADIEEKVSEASEMPKVYYVVAFGAGGEFTATGDTFISELITLAGGDNVAADGLNWSYSVEQIVEKNPEMIIYSDMLSKEELVVSNGFVDLQGVQDGEVYSINSSLIERTGPRLADGLEALAEIIHPELFN